jgi:hypothetical protein
VLKDDGDASARAPQIGRRSEPVRRSTEQPADAAQQRGFAATEADDAENSLFLTLRSTLQRHDLRGRLANVVNRSSRRRAYKDWRWKRLPSNRYQGFIELSSIEKGSRMENGGSKIAIAILYPPSSSTPPLFRFRYLQLADALDGRSILASLSQNFWNSARQISNRRLGFSMAALNSAC